MVEVGILLSQVNPRAYGELTTHAEALGFESVWLGEHLVLPTDPGRSRSSTVAITPTDSPAPHCLPTSGRAEWC